MREVATKRECLPIDSKTKKPIAPMETPGYYPGYSTLSQQKYWDAKTRQVVLDRVNEVPAIRFFDQREIELLEAICARLLPQDDRIESRRIPIVPHIDRRIFEKDSDGYRYENMPPDGEAYRLGLQAFDQMAQGQYGKRFADLDWRDQEVILKAVHDGEPKGADEIWKRLPVHRFWQLLVTDCVNAYYAHPWAWDEIGYGGPAYPRAYMRLERGEPEPWEKNEQRYEWDVPEGSLSGEYEFVAGEEEHHAPVAQGGTH